MKLWVRDASWIEYNEVEDNGHQHLNGGELGRYPDVSSPVLAHIMQIQSPCTGFGRLFSDMPQPLTSSSLLGKVFEKAEVMSPSFFSSHVDPPAILPGLKAAHIVEEFERNPHPRTGQSDLEESNAPQASS